MEDLKIKLELTVNDVNYILQMLGELPTKTGAWNLLANIKNQADPQVPVPQEETVQ
jgi:hypothetical protein